MTRLARATDTIWHALLTAPDERTAQAFSAAFEAVCGTVSAFEVTPGGAWTVEAYAAGEPVRAELLTAVELAATAAGAAVPELRLEPLPPVDWVAENQASFPALRVGRFYIHGSHLAGTVPAGAIGLLVDAAAAFGTGEHATTRGCLLALDRIATRADSRPHRILDMGSGTGILGIAAAKLFRRPVLACDIDRGSVRVAAENAELNGVAGLVHCLWSDGYRSRAVERRTPFDLIFANILARPLAAMAGDLARSLNPGGFAVLSGLLASQDNFVRAAHAGRGLHLHRRISIGGWRTLVLGKPKT
jgi:ribosomal protein L11 methyltransferase